MTTSHRSLMILISIIIYAAYLRTVGFTDVWSDNRHHDFDGAYYSIIARNYLRYGYLNTKFAQILDVGPLGPELSDREDGPPMRIFYDHPPLVPVLVSLSFKLFGISEWTARIVPLFFSMGSLIVLYILARKVWNERIALFSCFLMAIMPMAAYYGMDLSPEANVMIFSLLLTVYFYMSYLEISSAKYMLLINLSFLLGALGDWPTFYLAPLLLAHYLFFSKRINKSFFIFPLFACFVFIFLFFVYVKIVSGSYFSLVPFFLARVIVSYGTDLGGTEPFTLIQWFNQILSVNLEFYTLPILILFSIWFLNFINKVVKRQRLAEDLVVMILLLFGLIHIILGRQGAWFHEYWSALLIPGLAFSSALSLDRFYSFISNFKGAKLPIRGGFYLLLLAFAIYCTAKLYSLPYLTEYWFDFGTKINKNSEFHDEILTSEQIWPYLSLEFYADRNLYGSIKTLDRFYTTYKKEPQKYRYFFLPQYQISISEDLYAFLDNAFDSRIVNGILIFDLKSKKIDDIEINNYLNNYLKIGQYGFLDNLNGAEILPEGEDSVRQDLTFSINQDERKVIFQHPDSKITFKNIFIHDSTSLKFGIGIDPSAWDKGGDGVSFEVIVNYSGGDYVLFSKYINPKSKLDDRRWHDEIIDLSAFGNQAVAITLVTEGGPNNNTDYDWAGWSNLELIYKKAETEKIRK